MKSIVRFLFIFSVSIFFCSQCSQCSNKEICKLRIASYNILGGELSDWQGTRITLVNNIIQQYNFDIFGTQEGTSGQMYDIIVETGYAYIGNGREPDGSGEHNSIVYKTSRFELLDQGKFFYSETPEIASKGWDATGYNRMCIWGKFKDVISRREFYVFNSHFDHIGEKARLESARLKLAKMKSIADGYPIFATGDYNCTPESEPIQLLLNDGLLKDAYVLSEQNPYGSVGTFNGFREELPPNRIDFILVTDGIRIKEYGVINDRPDGKFPSDHDAVLAVVEF